MSTLSTTGTPNLEQSRTTPDIPVADVMESDTAASIIEMKAAMAPDTSSAETDNGVTTPVVTPSAVTPEVAALLRLYRILRKQLYRSERTRAEMEADNHHREHVFKKALRETEAYSAKLAAAKVELTQLNQQLEDRVEIGSAALTKATDHLQQAQVQMANSEKLSMLGELVAGVAHEINNPVGCITSNMGFVEEYGQQMLAHISFQQTLIESIKAQIDPRELAAIYKHADDIELDYLTEDFPKLVESVSTSGERIKAISQSLRTFARADTTQMQPYDLHEGIEGTLLILRHRLKADGERPAIVLNKKYGDFAKINCYPGQVNQVFMNILANAIDAMEEGEKPSGPPEISIETRLVNDQVIVTISDNAGGMPEAVKARIFESQFTTKAAGKGTGLGLSIAHHIVTEGHRGRIECLTQLGVGTTFRVSLPVD